MESKNLNLISLALIKDLENDINDLLKCQSNIELIWKLEELHNQKILLKSSELIRKSL